MINLNNIKVIFELGCNHNGNMSIAKRMIDDAAKLGVWGVKLQKRDIASIPENVASIPRDSKNSFGVTYREHRAFLEFDVKQIMELKKHVESRNLHFAVSVFDTVSIQQMIDCGIAYIKLPSQFLCNREINEALFDKMQNYTKIWHSTGMHTVKQLMHCEYLREFDVTFYCRSMYPFCSEQLDTGSMLWLYNALGDNKYKGYSSHDRDGYAIPIAIQAGATWIERHYTLDKNMKGSDHATVSSDYKEMKKILESIDHVQECLYMDKLSNCEQAVRDTYIPERKDDGIR